MVNGQHGTAFAARVVDDAMRWRARPAPVRSATFRPRTRDRGVGNDDLPWKQRDHALFVGFAPVDAPRYAVAVVVEHGGGGSSVAAPIARDALLRALTGGLPSLEAYPANQKAPDRNHAEGLNCACPTAANPLKRGHEA